MPACWTTTCSEVGWVDMWYNDMGAATPQSANPQKLRSPEAQHATALGKAACSPGPSPDLWPTGYASGSESSGGGGSGGSGAGARQGASDIDMDFDRW